MAQALATVPENALEKVIAGELPFNVYFGFNRGQLDAMAALGFNLYEQGRNRDAERIFKGLIALDSKLFYGYAGMGAMALSEEKLDEALSYLRKAAELEPNDPTIHANLGETLLRQAKFDEAAAEFEKALALDADEDDPGANRARAIIDGMEIVVSELTRLQKAAGQA